MAAGDVYQVGPTSVANSATFDLRPAATTEFSLHNVYYGGAVELYFTNGTNSVKWDADSSFGGRLNLSSHCTNAIWVQVKNVSGGAVYVAADGLYTK